jgi:hypothetical protein
MNRQLRHPLNQVMLLFILAASLLNPRAAAAQDDQDGWASPRNLSSSGAATGPVLVIDSLGNFHVIWKDEFAGLMYVSGDGLEWSEPQPVSLPFSDYLPRLIADRVGNIHAFWIDEEGGLYHGWVAASQFQISGDWRFTGQISDAALDFDASVDEAGQIQLAYIRTVETPGSPAGVYSTHLGEQSLNWASPQLVYQSAYLRSLLPENANISVSTGGNSQQPLVFIAWDNSLRDRVFLARSEDGGLSWGEAEEIDKPEEGNVDNGPARIKVHAEGEETLLLWQSGRTETSCDQYYRWSADGGLSWGPRQRMFAGFPICPDKIHILSGQSGPILLLEGAQVYLQAWDGAHWSDPQLQEMLTSFVDPETQQVVSYRCLEPALAQGEELYLVGCDSGEGKDIWLTKRPVGDISLWFPQEPVWNPLTTIASVPARLLDPLIISDPDNRLHVLWSQADSLSPGSPGTGIFYTRQEGVQWLQPSEILTSPQGKAEQPAAVVDSNGKLNLVWSGGESGEIYFSQANAGQAMSPSSWSGPALLPSPRQAGSSPGIWVDPDNNLFVVYAIPLNENRGIYLTRSTDGGASWSDPIRVFDGVAAGWEMVDRPRLAITGNGSLHLVWTQYTLPAGTGPLSLVFARSSDGGVTWSAPETVEEGSITWSQIIAIGEQTVERVWQEEGSGGTTLWHEESSDNGVNWHRTAAASVFGTAVGTPSLVLDDKDHLNLMQMVRRSANSFVVQHLTWDGNSWATERSLDLSFTTPTGIGSLMSTVSSQGVLNTLFTALIGEINSGDVEENILFTSRSLEGEETLLSLQATAIASPTTPFAATPEETPEPARTSSPSATPAPTATPTLRPTFEEPPEGNSWLGSAAGALVAGLIVLSVIAGIVAFRKGKFRF